MNIKKILVAVYALSTTIAFAQEQRIKEESKTIFKPHWFIQAQIGAAHTVGEGEFTDLISPAAALNVGYKFAPAFFARFSDKVILIFGLPVSLSAYPVTLTLAAECFSRYSTKELILAC